MAGTILENLSGRKLAVLVSIVLIIQIICFLIGGLIAPSPSNVEQVLGTTCFKDVPEEPPLGKFFDDWSIPRGSQDGKDPVNCSIIQLDDKSLQYNEKVKANRIVFAFQIPLPKERQNLDYSRWMQNLIGVLQLEIGEDPENPELQPAENPLVGLEVKLGYRNKNDPPEKWYLLAKSVLLRRIHCHKQAEGEHGYIHDCDIIPLFELGSLHHDYYLLNVRIPLGNNAKYNEYLGRLQDVYMVFIHQNGGFTKVWVSLKTFFFPIIIATVCWYWRRIRLLARPPVLLEKMLLALAIGMTILNMPLEFLTLYVDMPFMLLLSDIRQGYFYATLLSFWLVFCGEHLMEGRKDDVERNRIRAYWKHLSAVAFACVCLFIFDICERGAQLKNPFESIWVSDVGSKLALAFIILALISASVYLIFLTYMLYRVLKNISFKKSALPSMSQARKMYYEGIIYRFKFLLFATEICAALTVIAYIIGQVSEGQWKWDEDINLEFTSAFFTGVYGMWNIYVFMLLVLYAPSHKYYPSPSDRSISQEEIEFSRLTTSEPVPVEPTEASSLTEFARKAALD